MPAMLYRVQMPLALVAVALAAVAALAWVASYFWTPQYGLTWPAGNGGQLPREHGFVLLASGRLFIVRQRAQIAPFDTSAPAPPAEIQARSLDPRPELLIDVSQLGMMSLFEASPTEPYVGRPIARISIAPIEQSLAQRSWWLGGFSSSDVAAPRVLVNDAMATMRISASSVPLWPFVPLGFPAAVALWRDYRRRRWAREGRCTACGYDLRESRERCPECGRPTVASVNRTLAEAPATQ